MTLWIAATSALSLASAAIAALMHDRHELRDMTLLQTETQKTADYYQDMTINLASRNQTLRRQVAANANVARRGW